jgi:hypothetical protein
MEDRNEKLKLIGNIMVAEEHFLKSKPRDFWYGDRFNELYEESLLSLQLKMNLLKRKIKDESQK